MIGYLVHIFHFENAHYININRSFKAKTMNKTSLSRNDIYLFRVPKNDCGFQLFIIESICLLMYILNGKRIAKLRNKTGTERESFRKRKVIFKKGKPKQLASFRLYLKYSKNKYLEKLFSSEGGVRH